MEKIVPYCQFRTLLFAPEHRPVSVCFYLSALSTWVGRIFPHSWVVSPGFLFWLIIMRNWRSGSLSDL